MALGYESRGWGTYSDEKKQRQIFSCQCPFKEIISWDITQIEKHGTVSFYTQMAIICDSTQDIVQSWHAFSTMILFAMTT
jgi:hypothetical protein